MKALLIVDVQNDFCPGGALAAPHGDQVIQPINELMDRFALILTSRDYHPGGSRHFNKWPVHCVRGTKGAKYHPALQVEKADVELLKGTGDKDDGYSAFEATNEDLNGLLERKNVQELYIAGLTTEFCVKETALDARRNGFVTYLLTDAIASVEPGSDQEREALEEMKEAGVLLVNSSMLSRE